MSKHTFNKPKKSEPTFKDEMKSKPRPTPSYLRQLKGLKNLRDTHESERKYYKKNKDVAGMAAPKGKVTLNPYNKHSEGQKEAVYHLEEARHHIKKSKDRPKFKLTDEQEKKFAKYGAADKDKKSIQPKRESIISRLTVGDFSSGLPTNEQIAYAKKVEKEMQKKKTSYNHPKKK